MMEENSDVQSHPVDEPTGDWIPGPVRIPVIPDIVDLGRVATVSSDIARFGRIIRNYLDIRDRKITVDTDSPAHRDWQEVRSTLYRTQEETLGRSFNAVKDDIDADRRIIAILADVSGEGVSAKELSSFLIPHRTEQEILDAMSWVDANTGDEIGLVRIDGKAWKRSRILNVKALLNVEVRGLVGALANTSYESGDDDGELADLKPLPIAAIDGMVERKFRESIRPRKSDVDVRLAIQNVAKRSGKFLNVTINEAEGEDLVAILDIDGGIIMVVGWRWLMRKAVPEFDESQPIEDVQPMSAAKLRNRLKTAIIAEGVDEATADVDEAVENAAENIEDIYPERFSGFDDDPLDSEFEIEQSGAQELDQGPAS